MGVAFAVSGFSAPAHPGGQTSRDCQRLNPGLWECVRPGECCAPTSKGSVVRKSRLLGLTLTAAALFGCSDSPAPTQPGGGGPAPVLLKDIVVSNLPAPYYHFDYDAGGRVTGVSFASGVLIYRVRYLGGKISELQDSALGNTDRLQYVYDLAGRVHTVNYVDPSDQTVARVQLTYSGNQLTELDRERDYGSGLVLDKTMMFSYYADGNLEEIVDHRPAVNGSPEGTTVDHFEQYDDNVNVDAFALIHNDFFDHIVLLPGVVLQKGNPARETFTSGDINYRFDYVYTFDGSNRPLTKGGTATVLSGADSGRVIPLSTTFSYY